MSISGEQRAFQARLDLAMKAKGLDQTRLAEALRGAGLPKATQQMVSSWLREKHPAWPLGQAIGPLARVLDVSAHWLLLDEGPMEPPGADVIAIYERGRERGWSEAVETLRATQAAIRATGSGAIPDEAMAEIEQVIAEDVQRRAGTPRTESPKDRPA